jgi:hypothetical protein
VRFGLLTKKLLQKNLNVYFIYLETKGDELGARRAREPRNLPNFNFSLNRGTAFVDQLDDLT